MANDTTEKEAVAEPETPQDEAPTTIDVPGYPAAITTDDLFATVGRLQMEKGLLERQHQAMGGRIADLELRAVELEKTVAELEQELALAKK